MIEHPLAGHHNDIPVRVRYPDQWGWSEDGRDALCAACTSLVEDDGTPPQQRVLAAARLYNIPAELATMLLRSFGFAGSKDVTAEKVDEVVELFRQQRSPATR